MPVMTHGAKGALHSFHEQAQYVVAAPSKITKEVIFILRKVNITF